MVKMEKNGWKWSEMDESPSPLIGPPAPSGGEEGASMLRR
jgi:hypothetical protein